MVRQMLAASRFLVIFAVIGTFVASVTTMLFAGVSCISNVLMVIFVEYGGASGGKKLAVAMLELIDLYLLGIILFLIAAGLCELFVAPGVPLPEWMKVADLEQLKGQIISVVIVLLGITFLGKAVTWEAGWEIAAFGVGIAVVIWSLYLVLRQVAAEERNRRR
ncbi:MAG: hypothetical protein KatS3mg060_1819 [Dehalococcoidia bacterium]|nr:MAG: hypothetical protein KatS3mg060_1819 [Dehalococcoidia bacterium]